MENAIKIFSCNAGKGRRYQKRNILMVVSADRAYDALSHLSTTVDEALLSQEKQLIIDADALRNIADVLKWLTQIADTYRSTADNL